MLLIPSACTGLQCPLWPKPVELRGLKGTLTEQGAAVIQAVASSQVTPEQAAKLLQALAAQAKIEEADRLEKRICELEKAVGV